MTGFILLDILAIEGIIIVALIIMFFIKELFCGD
jgi:hypothetical protein